MCRSTGVEKWNYVQAKRWHKMPIDSEEVLDGKYFNLSLNLCMLTTTPVALTQTIKVQFSL